MLITREELQFHKINVDHTYPAGAFDDHGHTFSQVEVLRVQAAAEILESDIRILGSLSTRLEFACDRCAGFVDFPVLRNFDLLYRPMSTIARAEEFELPESELDVGFYAGAGVELEGLTREQVILAVPMKKLCRPDCRGLCAICGANLNLAACGCRETVIDSPFAVLLGRIR